VKLHFVDDAVIAAVRQAARRLDDFAQGYPFTEGTNGAVMSDVRSLIGAGENGTLRGGPSTVYTHLIVRGAVADAAEAPRIIAARKHLEQAAIELRTRFELVGSPATVKYKDPRIPAAQSELAAALRELGG
jgi:hypothetical protein